MKQTTEKKVKNKIDKKKIINRLFAGFLLVLMLLASCSTCIYYVVANIKK